MVSDIEGTIEMRLNTGPFLLIVCKTDLCQYLTIYVVHTIGSGGVRFHFIYMFGVSVALFNNILIKKSRLKPIDIHLRSKIEVSHFCGRNLLSENNKILLIFVISRIFIEKTLLIY